MTRIAVLMTCFNRREMTLRCLASLRDEVKVRGEGEQWRLDIFLVDDCCTDGTAEKVKELGEGEQWKIHLIKGSGHDYWAKGMERAWIAALNFEKEQNLCSHPSSDLLRKLGFASGDISPFTFTFFLWLNDDTELNPDALSTLLHFYTANPDAVINGTLINAKGEAVYGYNVRNTGLAGNCVLVPRKVYEKVGMICGKFAHGWADRDYGMRVERAGFRIVSAGVVGRTEWHPNRPSLKGVDFRGRCRMLRDPKGWNVHDLWLLRVRNWGVCAAIWSCAHLIFHVLLGERFNRR